MDGIRDKAINIIDTLDKNTNGTVQLEKGKGLHDLMHQYAAVHKKITFICSQNPAESTQHGSHSQTADALADNAANVGTAQGAAGGDSSLRPHTPNSAFVSDVDTAQGAAAASEGGSRLAYPLPVADHTPSNWELSTRSFSGVSKSGETSHARTGSHADTLCNLLSRHSTPVSPSSSTTAAHPNGTLAHTSWVSQRERSETPLMPTHTTEPGLVHSYRNMIGLTQSQNKKNSKGVDVVDADTSQWDD